MLLPELVVASLASTQFGESRARLGVQDASEDVCRLQAVPGKALGQVAARCGFLRREGDELTHMISKLFISSLR